jgi:hypothetical protein
LGPESVSDPADSRTMIGRPLRIGGVEEPTDQTLESRHMKFYDEEGRDLEATLRGDGFVWELWVDLETKNALVKKRFETDDRFLVGELQGPHDALIDYQQLLMSFVDGKTDRD